MERKCIQCGEAFTLTDSEIEFYKSKGLSLPKRCKSCRDANRKAKAAMSGDNSKKNYTNISVDYETNKQYQQKVKGKASPFHYIVALLIIVVIGLVTAKFGDFANPENYIDKPDNNAQQQFEYNFASADLLQSHFNKHGDEFGYNTPEEYLKGANDVINNPSALHKVQAEDGDDCYYLQSTNEFVVVSPDGNIKTYFKPDDGIEYFNRQMKMVSLLTVA